MMKVSDNCNSHGKIINYVATHLNKSHLRAAFGAEFCSGREGRAALGAGPLYACAAFGTESCV